MDLPPGMLLIQRTNERLTIAQASERLVSGALGGLDWAVDARGEWAPLAAVPGLQRLFLPGGPCEARAPLLASQLEPAPVPAPVPAPPEPVPAPPLHPLAPPTTAPPPSRVWGVLAGVTLVGVVALGWMMFG